MKYLKFFLKEQKGKVILTLLLILGQSVGTLLIPFLVAGMVDNGILAGDMGEILRIGGWMLAVSFLTTLISIGGSWYSADLAARFGHDMRERLICKTQELSVQEFNTIGVSSMVTRSTSDMSTMQSTFGMVLQLMIPAPFLAAASVAMTIDASPRLAIVLITCTVLFILFSFLILKSSNRLSQQIQQKMDRINQLVRESVTGTRVIRAFGNEQYEEKRSGKAFEDYAGIMIKLNKLFAVVNPAVWLVIGLCMAVIVWLGSQFTVSGTMEIGQITAVSEYTILTLSYLIMAAAVSTSLPKMRSCLNRLQQVLDIEPQITDPEIPMVSLRTGTEVVSFDNVTFSYPNAEEAVLHHLSFQCRMGETTAIIGGTGSGKSTVADLLLRLHDVDGGTVSLYGSDVRSITLKSLRDMIGYVPQKAFLFSGTIAENLRMSSPQASEADLWEALRVAQADTFVSSLPQGLDAPVSQGGTNFSGGQRQRLAIARALVKRAAVYLFDDSFSALDVKTDAALRKALSQYGTNAAKIIIAQRVSTITDADQILVLDNGRLIGCGRHEKLLKTCKIYQDIVSSQMERKGAQAL